MMLVLLAMYEKEYHIDMVNFRVVRFEIVHGQSIMKDILH